MIIAIGCSQNSSSTSPGANSELSNSAQPITPWTKLIPSLESYSSYVKSDENGNIYVAGDTKADIESTSCTNSCGFLLKYNINGELQWSQVIESSANTWVKGITFDSDNNIYVSGTINGDLDSNTLIGTKDLFVVKYNSAGSKLWTKTLGVSSFDTSNTGIAVSGSMVFVTGYTKGNLSGEQLTGTKDLFVVKYNTSGIYESTKLLGVASKITEPNAMSISNDSVYITGSTNGGLEGNTLQGIYDSFITKFDFSLNLIWVKQFGTSSMNTLSRGITLDKNDAIIITGYTDGTLNGEQLTGLTDVFVLKLDNDGSVIWTKLFGSLGPNNEANTESLGVSVISDQSANYYITGSTTGSIANQPSNEGNASFVAKLDSNGNQQWVRQFGATGSTTEAFDITIYDDVNLFVVGSTDDALDAEVFQGTPYDTYNGFIKVLSTSGDL